MSIQNSRLVQNVKVMMLRGEKGEKGDKGDPGDYIANQYTSLGSKPQINNITLEGNKSLASLGINYPALDSKPQINGVTLSGNKSFADLDFDINDYVQVVSHSAPVNQSISANSGIDKTTTLTSSLPTGFIPIGVVGAAFSGAYSSAISPFVFVHYLVRVTSADVYYIDYGVWNLSSGSVTLNNASFRVLCVKA